LYPMLTRLKNDDILTYSWFESSSGPPRKYYKLTKNGEIFLENIRQSWNELVISVNIILKTN